MYEVAKIESFKTDAEGTTLLVKVPNRYLGDFFYNKRIKECEIRFDDGRTISSKQRKKAYATMGDIALFTGDNPEAAKQFMKYLHITRTGCKDFSLSNCSVDTAKEFINTLIDFALHNGIPLSDNLVNRADDIDKAMYYCIKHKKCVVCGRDGEIHHVDAIGMGNNRNTVDDSQHRKMCLCREHHTLAHQKGMNYMESMYKVYGIKYTGEKDEL